MTEFIYIFGTGAHARKAYQCAIEMGFGVIEFVDENLSAVSPVPNVLVVEANTALKKVKLKSIFIAVGDPDVRQRIMNLYLADGWNIPILIHPSANVAPAVEIHSGALVARGAIIESGTIVGQGAIIDVGAIVDHDCFIAPFSHLRAGQICQPRTHWKGLAE
jgi:UDP-N-acetylbacillosamine N-acetyltransferase